MNWTNLTEIEQLEEIVSQSAQQPILIFKHSTRCSISSMAKSRVERQWKFEEEAIKPYYLDLIAFRAVSNEIVTKFDIPHQSPQVLLIKDGVCVYNASHNAISAAAIPV